MVKGQTMAIGAYCIHYVYFGSPFAYALYIRFGLSKKKKGERTNNWNFIQWNISSSIHPQNH